MTIHQRLRAVSSNSGSIASAQRVHLLLAVQLDEAVALAVQVEDGVIADVIGDEALAHHRHVVDGGIEVQQPQARVTSGSKLVVSTRSTKPARISWAIEMCAQLIFALSMYSLIRS